MNRWKTNKIEKQHQRPIYCFSIHEHIPVYSSHFYCSSQCSQQKVWVPFTNKVCLWIAGLFDPDTGIYKVGSMCGPQLSTKQSHTHTHACIQAHILTHTYTHSPATHLFCSHRGTFPITGCTINRLLSSFQARRFEIRATSSSFYIFFNINYDL